MSHVRTPSERPTANHLVRKRPESAFRHQRRIQIPHRAGRRVARVGKQRLAGVLTFLVDPRKGRPREEEFAADLQPSGGAALQRQRNRADGADVGGDVFATNAVTARSAARQPAVLISQRDTETIDLQLGHVIDGRVPEPGTLPNAFIERAQLGLVVGVVETEHRGDVFDGWERGGRPSGDTLRRRVLGDQVGMRRLELLEFVQQTVELLVGDLRRGENVVAVLVVADLLAELLKAGENVHRARLRSCQLPISNSQLPTKLGVGSWSWELTPAASTVRGSASLPVPGEHVIRQRHQGVTFAAGREDGEAPLARSAYSTARA